MTEVKFLAYKGSDWLAKIIKYQTQSDYSHNFFLRLVDMKAKFDYVAGFGLFTKWKKEKKGQYFCSEGCITPLVKIFDWSYIKPWKISPEAFIQIIQAAGGKLIKKEIVK